MSSDYDAFEFIESPSIHNGILEGYAMMFEDSYKVKVTLDIEKETSNIEDFRSLANVSYDRISRLNLERFKILKKEITNRITTSSYSQSEYIPTEKDFHSLQNELKIDQINFYTEDFVLLFYAKNNFPDSTIYIQLNDAFEIENIEVLKS
ncbi:hypothetical protein [Aquimarina litoralis]|uniref:hypothetical protein n=1 Tax=Aquimarina litoralis TaxID=584605 RepID=UPI001C591A41|nr:hypothetical protein [Aquimarina litoralis]MBW1296761.1 hypothetical protein [Aquimarina litoralis]